jgi:hypothetical protein
VTEVRQFCDEHKTGQGWVIVCDESYAKHAKCWECDRPPVQVEVDIENK